MTIVVVSGIIIPRICAPPREAMNTTAESAIANMASVKIIFFMATDLDAVC